LGVETILAALAALVISALLTGMVRSLAISHGVLDVPNERSSHKVPTPRGGGAAIVVATSVALIALGWLGAVRIDLSLSLCGGVAVAVVGFLDDRRPLSARVRLAVHLTTALWALLCLRGFPPLRVGEHVVTLGWMGYVLGILGIAWVLNLFNFMDGIDGIAASEAVFIACGGTLLSLVGAATSGVAAACLVFGAACGGFLLWNWPPAKIFMGDVGSGYLGYAIGVLALAATRENPAALWSWLILGGVFFADASVTLARRTIRGERVYEAHRSHAYQWLARRWGSHSPVTIAVILVNLLWLLPCATLATLYSDHAPLIAVVALAPIVVITTLAGSGRRETRAT
jgi:Fuc2NAc and GlcNAc transferase